ncbi:Caffeine resistance protein 5 [Venturia inaequalis]|nr:Caffeine resistance protein 5 [Venturia inaequalis]
MKSPPSKAFLSKSSISLNASTNMSSLLIESSKYLTQKQLLARQITSLTADLFLEVESMKNDKYKTPENVSYLTHAPSHLNNLKKIAGSMMIAEHQYNRLVLELDIFLARYAIPPSKSPVKTSAPGKDSDAECLAAMAAMKNDLSESIELLKLFIQNATRYCQEHVQKNEATDRICPCC